MKKSSLFVQAILFSCVALLLTSCATIRQGEVGVKRTFGKYADEPYTDGLKVFNPFATRIIKISTQTENLEVDLNIPSKEGLVIRSEVSILYNVIGDQAPELLRNIGQDYERNIILPVFRSSVSDVTARFYAKDMHTGERSTIENAIRDQMMKHLEGKGLVVEAVLLKSIQMPASLANAIEEKLEAEQRSQRMQFVLQEARQQADQKRIEAEGVRDAQKIIAEGLTPEILQFKSIEAFKELAKSPNAKIIVTDGDLPMLMENAPTINAGQNNRVKLSN